METEVFRRQRGRRIALMVLATGCTFFGPDCMHNRVVTTRLGLTPSTQYDPQTATHPISSIDLTGHAVARTFDSVRGLLLSETDPNGRRTIFAYDPLGRRIETSVRAPGLLSFAETVETITYAQQPDGSSIVAMVRPIAAGVVSADSLHTDEWGRVLSADRMGAAGIVRTTTEYDAFDRPVRVSAPFKPGAGSISYTETKYDELGRPVRTTSPGPNGPVISTQDPSSPLVVTLTNSEGITRRGYAIPQVRPNGQVVREYKALDGTLLQTESTTANMNGSGWSRIRYHQDANGRVTRVTRGSGPSPAAAEDPALSVTVAYDEFGRRAQVVDPGRGTMSFTYNAQHQSECLTQGDGSSICRTYDAGGRLKELRRDSTSGPVLVTYAYDEGASDGGVGRVTSVVDESGTRRLHYDALTGNVSRVVRKYVSRGENRTFEVGYRYSSSGTLIEKRFPASDLTLAYDYHPEGSLREVRLLDPEHRILRDGQIIPVVDLSAPDALGNSAQIMYGNGVSIATQYDGIGNRKRVTAQGPAGTLLDHGFNYNDEGLITKKTDLLGQGVDTTEQFQYDIMRRLTSATGPYGTVASPQATITYAHGPDGQLRKKGIYSAGYLGPHRMTQLGAVAYRYDVQNGPGRGNVVTRVQRAPGSEVVNAADGAANVVPTSADINATITYGPFNRIARVDSQSPLGWTQATYKYDDSGRRFQKLVTAGGNVIETSYVNGDYRIERRNDGETHTLEFSLGHTLIARHSFEFDSGSFSAGLTRGLIYERMLANGGRLLNGRTLSVWFGSLLGFVQNGALWVRSDPNLSTRLFYAVFLVVMMTALVWLFRVWRRDHSFTFWQLPAPTMRFASLLLLFAFQTVLLQGCVGVLGPGEKDRPPLFALPPNGQFNVGGSGTPSAGGGAGGQVGAFARGYLGSYFYIPSANGSTDVVTDGRGVVVQRFVYDPYGNVNRELSDFDPDRDGQYFAPAFRFTGQEYDDETGLYNYHARLYDPGTGRFMQADPVHTDRAGMDSYDRYEYVNANPVNFVDPDGESWLTSAMHNFNRGVAGVARRFNSFTGSLGKDFRKFQRGGAASVKHFVHNFDHATHDATRKEALVGLALFAGSGMSPEAFTLLTFLMWAPAGEEPTWFGHNYSGAGGNKNRFDGFFTGSRYFLLRYAITLLIMRDVFKVPVGAFQAMMWLYFVMKDYISPKPKTWADGLGRRHDREWGSGSAREIFDANNHWITGYARGVWTRKFWVKPVDSIVVGGGGALLFACMNYCLLGLL